MTETAAGLAVAGGALDGQVVVVRIEGDRIVEVGPDVQPRVDDQVVDATGCVVTPGLVNAHTHAAMTLFRGYGDDLPLMTWLQTKIWPAEGRLDAEDVYWGTRLAAVEMVRSGTTCFWDMYWHGPAVARAVADAGLRAHVSSVFFDGGDPAQGEAQRPQVLEDLDAIAEHGPLVRPMLGPHAVYTVSTASLEWLAGVAAERDLPFHIHLSETRGEVEDCVTDHGDRPAVLLDRLGALTHRTLAAHGCYLDPAEVELVADRGATVATCPTSNMKLANGRVFPYPEAATVGVPVGLGTDGASSNNCLDLLQEVKVLALAQKHAAEDPAVLPAHEALEVATGRCSPLLGGQALAPGAPADLVLVRVDGPELVPSEHDAGLVYAATGAQVDTTIVAGRVLMQHRRIEGIDEVLGQVRARAGRLRSG